MKRNRSDSHGEIRIIGGTWRSRRIRFPATDRLRPSPDPVRERLFSWLQWDIVGSHCLDLFAGSGAIGFEAVSRGASHVTMVESDPRIVRTLTQNVEMLNAGDRISVVHDTVDSFLRKSKSTHDLVFMDPPFTDDLIGPTCRLLSNGKLIADSTLLYIESPATKGELPVPADWHIIRQKDHGLVRSTLLHIRPSFHDL